MSDGKTFFTFPLCLLSMPEPPQERIQYIVSHSVMRAGEANRDTVSEDRVADYVKRYESECKYTDQERDYVRGALVCDVNSKSIPGSLSRVQAANKFISAHEIRYGRDPLVFVSTSLLWGCHDNNDPPFREFATLCAINSIIGHKRTPVLIRRCLLIPRQLGFKTPAVMAAELERRRAEALTFRKADREKARTQLPVPLSIQNLRSILDRLEDRGLMTRCQASRTRVYFQTWGSIDELRTGVKAIVEEYRKVKARREIDRAVVIGENNQASTKRQPTANHLKRKTPVSVESQPLKKEQPTANQPSTTEVTNSQPPGQPLKEESSNNSLLTNALNKERDVCSHNFEESKPPTKPEVAAHFESLFPGSGKHASDYIDNEAWKSSTKPWTQSSGAWVADRISKAKREAVA